MVICMSKKRICNIAGATDSVSQLKEACNPEVIKSENLTALAGEETPLRNELITKIFINDMVYNLREYEQNPYKYMLSID